MNVLEKISEEIKNLKRKQNSSNQDYYTGYLSALSTVEGIIAGMDCGWIPVTERLPEEDMLVLMSFDNFPLILTGRYKRDDEGGAFYVGEDKCSCASHYIFVNAWQSLPEAYKGV